MKAFLKRFVLRWRQPVGGGIAVVALCVLAPSQAIAATRVPTDVFPDLTAVPCQQAQYRQYIYGLPGSAKLVEAQIGQPGERIARMVVRQRADGLCDTSFVTG